MAGAAPSAKGGGGFGCRAGFSRSCEGDLGRAAGGNAVERAGVGIQKLSRAVDPLRCRVHPFTMTITARVHNHSIALPPDLSIAEGAEVQVTVPDRKVPLPDWLQRAVGTATTGLSTDEILRETRGED